MVDVQLFKIKFSHMYYKSSKINAVFWLFCVIHLAAAQISQGVDVEPQRAKAILQSGSLGNCGVVERIWVPGILPFY